MPGVDDGDEAIDGNVSDDLGLASDDDTLPSKTRNNPLELSLGYRSIYILLVVLCLSAVVLWYRIFLLHSHLELRLSPEGAGEQKAPITSLYSPQVE